MRRDRQPEAMAERQERPARRRYRPPRLDRLGDLRGLTLGATPGIPDSGIGVTQEQQP